MPARYYWTAARFTSYSLQCRHDVEFLQMMRKALDNRGDFYYNHLVEFIEVWLSLVERCVRDAEAAGSSPVTSTSPGVHMNTRIFYLVKCRYGHSILRPLERPKGWIVGKQHLAGRVMMTLYFL